MIGVDNIIKMRMDGQAPMSVFIETRPMNEDAKRYTNNRGTSVDIHMDQSDVARVETADLRCLVGLIVVICGTNESDLDRIASACLKAGAAKVESCHFDQNADPYSVRALIKTRSHKKDGVKVLWQY